jgi:hypothetical protein
MIGRGLEQTARALVRPDTFDATIAPAIADLQHEASLGTWARVRGYASVWRALGATMTLEIAGDCVDTFHAAHIRQAIGPALVIPLVALGVIMPWPMWHAFHSWRPWHHSAVLVALFIPGILVPILPAIALPISAQLARTRRQGAMRSAVLLTTVAVFTLAFATADVARRTEPLRGELFIASVLSVRAVQADRPIWESRDRFATQIAAIRRPSDPALQKFRLEAAARRAREARQRWASLALTIVAFALFGAALSRWGRWWTAALAIGVLFLDFGARTLFDRVLYIQNVFGSLTTMWTLASVLFLTSCLVTVRARRTLRT